MLRIHTLLLSLVALTGVAHRAPGQSPLPGTASDSASVRVILQAVLEKLAPYSAAAAVRADTVAWSIVTPSSETLWERAHVWLAQLLRARPPVPGVDDMVRLVLIPSAIVRGDSLHARFTVGTTFPFAHRSPSTTYELSAKWNGTGWGRPEVRAIFYVD